MGITKQAVLAILKGKFYQEIIQEQNLRFDEINARLAPFGLNKDVLLALERSIQFTKM